MYAKNHISRVLSGRLRWPTGDKHLCEFRKKLENSKFMKVQKNYLYMFGNHFICKLIQ